MPPPNANSKPSRLPLGVKQIAIICAVLAAFVVPTLLQYYFRAFDGPRQILQFGYGEPYKAASSYTIYFFGDPILTRTPASDSGRELEHVLWSVAPVTAIFLLSGCVGWFSALAVVRRVRLFRPHGPTPDFAGS
ncbi:hypothetical protein [Limnoglobus roseus]|uniref:hypothetical protein n=1 Tax=Limnoglobus roseus TaxID=2598579 RepID=UPI0011EB99BF|nr:hypothetical protein [Limnoglobus roseus]